MEITSLAAVEVKIFNQTYYVRGDGDAEYIVKLAEYVDQRMREVSGSTLTADSLRVAILTALNIADELYKMRIRLEQLDNSLAERSAECAALLDGLLKKPKLDLNK